MNSALKETGLLANIDSQCELDGSTTKSRNTARESLLVLSSLKSSPSSNLIALVLLPCTRASPNPQLLKDVILNPAGMPGFHIW